MCVDENNPRTYNVAMKGKGYHFPQKTILIPSRLTFVSFCKMKTTRPLQFLFRVKSSKTSLEEGKKRSRFNFLCLVLLFPPPLVISGDQYVGKEGEEEEKEEEAGAPLLPMQEIAGLPYCFPASAFGQFSGWKALKGPSPPPRPSSPFAQWAFAAFWACHEFKCYGRLVGLAGRKG